MALTNDIKLEPFLTGIANAIRTKEESTDMIDAVDFAQRILNIPSKVSQSGLSFTSCEK